MPQSSPPNDRADVPVVESRDLYVSYGTRPVVRGVDLTVRRGEVLAVIGANGSGKSTLVKALIGLVPVSSGEVRIFGNRRIGRREREQIGYVPQRVGAAGGVPATVTEVVRSGLHSGLLRRTSKDWRTALDEALEATGLQDLRHRPVAALSGGQQQRVLIARALIRRPQLLILDEPLAGVDLDQQASFAQTLARISGHGHTIILVLHEFGAIGPLLTRVISLADGVIDFDARPEDAQLHCETNDQPDWVRAAHDHTHPHDDPHQEHTPWMPQALPAREAHQ
ncbi:metal ABC transporter ATP-binding protein [Cumulibacter manganitolerans]|uniref:metal ABC transporter ATP-binding protein n=1 Tax=Cumulibacter manganitolerans TaxID=1884992 RepID=UPI001E323E14|nr:metal ABC transporter ATP-binding protein [Cumulibacter manganitolerans]